MPLRTVSGSIVPLTAAALLAAALVGGVYGVAGTIGHSLMWGPIPVGLIIGAVACGRTSDAVRTAA